VADQLIPRRSPPTDGTRAWHGSSHCVTGSCDVTARTCSPGGWSCPSPLVRFRRASAAATRLHGRDRHQWCHTDLPQPLRAHRPGERARVV